jgi:adenylate cyclase
MPVNEPDPFSALSATLFSTTRRTIVCVDVVESVRLMEEDEQGTIERWQAIVNYIANQLMPKHGGRLVKSLGDGALMEFVETAAAGRAALALQAFVRDGFSAVARELALQVRIGLHVADVVHDQFDVYGRGVNLAARIASISASNEITVSASVRSALTEDLDGEFEDMGDCYLKHLEQPVHVYRMRRKGDTAMPAPSPKQTDFRPALAVIPFRQRVSSPDHAVLGNVLADELISAISRTPELHVISRLTTHAFAARELSLAEINSHLNAAFVVSGSYVVSGGEVRVSIELADARAGDVVWSDHARGEVQDVLMGDSPLIESLTNEISTRIIAREVTSVQCAALPTLQSCSLLLGAIGLMHRASLSESTKAHEILEELVHRHGGHATPHAWMAKFRMLRVWRGWTDDVKRETQEALTSTQRALDVRPDSSLALTIRGLIHSHLLKDSAEADRYYGNALTANPNESLAWLFRGSLYAFQGRGDDAMSATRTAIRLSPLDPIRYYYHALAAGACLTAGQYQEGIALAERSLKANRGHPSTYRILAICYVLTDDVPRAQQTVSSLMQIDPGFTLRRYIEQAPGANTPLGQTFVKALAVAGVPE